MKNSLEAEPDQQASKHDDPATLGQSSAVEIGQQANASESAKDSQPSDNKQEPSRWARFKQSTSEVSLSDWLMVAFTAVIAIWAGLQWREMHGGGEQTDKIIAADQRIAAAMEGAVSQAQAAFASTTMQAEIAQRAWVYVTVHPAASEKYTSGKTFDIRITTKNSGRTPAMRARSVYVISTVTKEQSPDLSLPLYTFKAKDWVPQGNIEPDSTRYADKTYNFTADDVRRLDIMDAKIYVHGRVEYDDVFGTHHWLTFCTVLINGGDFALCAKGNESDNNQPKNAPKPN